MEVIRGIAGIKKYPWPVVALGVFDGVHRGHRVILKAAVKRAKAIHGRSMALTFWPHPQKEESLYSLKHRLRLIGAQGIDVCVVINFNAHFSGLSAEDFIKKVLCNKIGARFVYIGKNFRFGKNAEGDYLTLERFSHSSGFRLKVFAVVKTKNRPVSSTYIRSLIRRGSLSDAKKLLAHPVSILGTVVRGISLATKLGFPTANINPHHEVIPPPGVYVVEVIFRNEKFHGVCYIGPRAIARPARTVEVHILNFKKNIYGQDLEIQFLKKIREAKKFASSGALVARIKKDIRVARHIFSRH